MFSIGCHRHVTDPLAILKENESAVLALSSYRGESAQLIQDKDGSHWEYATLVVERPDKTRLDVWEVPGSKDSPGGRPSPDAPTRMTWIIDGAKETRRIGQAYRERQTLYPEGPLGLAPGALFLSKSRSLYAQCANPPGSGGQITSVKYAGEATVGGEACDKVILDWATDALRERLTGTSTYYISEKDHLVRRRVSRSRFEGEPGPGLAMDVSITNIQVNKIVPPGTFEYKPPPTPH